MSTKVKKYKKQENIGIALILIGIITIVLDFAFLMRIIYQYTYNIYWGILIIILGTVLFSIGLRFLIHSSKKIPSKKTREQLPVESRVEIEKKRFKLKRKSGIYLTIIGLVPILLGIILWIILPSSMGFDFGMIFGMIFLVIGLVLFLPGVGLWVQSVSIKERIKEVEESL